MGVGLEIFRPDGSVRLSSSDRLTRVAGIVTVTSGQVVSVDTSKGTPWGVMFTPTTSTEYKAVTISGGNITAPHAGILIYGVY